MSSGELKVGDRRTEHQQAHAPIPAEGSYPVVGKLDTLRHIRLPSWQQHPLGHDRVQIV